MENKQQEKMNSDEFIAPFEWGILFWKMSLKRQVAPVQRSIERNKWQYKTAQRYTMKCLTPISHLANIEHYRV